jgi:acetyltransferase-like isoleucine patch superfamily enzyme
MTEWMSIADYKKNRPARLRRWGWLFKLVSKVNRDWVFSFGLRARLYRFMGVNVDLSGDRVFIGRETWLDDNFPELISIGDGVVFGWRCNVLTHNTQMLPPSVAPVRIGRKCFFGTGVTIMPGVTIGEYAQIGSGAVVIKDIEPYTVAVGIPAKPIRKLTDDEIRLREDYR